MSSDLRTEFNSSPDGAGDWIARISDQSEWGDYRMDEWRDLGVLPFFGPMVWLDGPRGEAYYMQVDDVRWKAVDMELMLS